MEKHIFHIKGLHCTSCVLLTEQELKEQQGVIKVVPSLSTHKVEVTGNFDGEGREEVMRRLSAALEPHGYSLSEDKEDYSIVWRDFTFALPIAAIFIAFFVLLQKIGLINFVTMSQMSLSTVFVIGLIASVSSCMAVVGGLLFSLSASFAKSGEKIRPQMYFHLGRLLSFFILGGVIGILGASFKLTPLMSSILSIGIALILLILGINLLNVSENMRRLQPTFPKKFGLFVFRLKKYNYTLTPFLVGVATFFLPCGFTQSMQLYALSAGSFISGALVMFVFALGTFPVLSLVSFSALTIRKKSLSGVFFKTAGLIVIFFAIINLASSLAALGLINPLFMF